ncbi:glycosyltransferase [Roseomonas gilardii]|uniref:glycosyltransferase n=1 Tax=Roseomonas gilardii TaxID=257708 RepID=UPI000E04E8FF|nr:glycosyltransferase [Roseomonas gilardii]SUE42811.1 Glycosyl transferase family 8 [Roseomonas gilardii subsp. rosea]
MTDRQSSLNDDIAIITGADDRHIEYLYALLNSLEFFNDKNFPIYIMDFGFSEEKIHSIKQKYPYTSFLPITSIDADIARMREAPGVPQIEGIEYILSTMRKLSLADFSAKQFFLWLDADTVVLKPISEWLPQPQEGKIIAGRNSRRELAFQFKNRSPLVREALADHLLKKLGISSVTQNSFNSGVILADSAYYRQTVAWARKHFLIDFGPYLMGDQAIINVAMSLQQHESVDIPPGINVSISGPEGKSELLHQTYKGKAYATIDLGNGPVSVYHFLNIKPHLARDKNHPVCRLLGEWQQQPEIANHSTISNLVVN